MNEISEAPAGTGDPTDLDAPPEGSTSVGQRAVLIIAVFVAGGLLMALQVAAFRIVGKTFGSALRETTTVIAVFMAAMSAGYWAGGRIGDRRPRITTLAGTLSAAAVVLCFIPWIDALAAPRIAASSLSLWTHAFAASTLLFAIPTFFLATTSPIAVRLLATTTGRSGTTAGSVSSISTFGSIAGTIFTAYYLLDRLQSVSRTVLFVATGAALTAGMLLVAQAPASLHHRIRSRRTAGIALAAVLALTAAGFLVQRSTGLDRALIEPLPGTRIVHVADSPYHRIVVKERGDFRELYFNLAIQSRMKVGDPYGPGNPYTDSFHVAPLMRPSIRRVLMIGLGGGTGAKQYLHFYPEATIDAVEVDPMVVSVAERYFELPFSERLRIHVMDGRTFLKRTADRWDLVIIDAYTTNRYGDTLPPHLVTREFFEEVASRLTDHGIIQFHCAFGNEESRILDALHRTIESVYPYVLRSGGELFASMTPLITPKETMHARLIESPAARLPQLASYIDSLASTNAPRDAVLLTDDYAPVETLITRR
ncbi:MAG TPA: fused MFS/spermidine synthase [Thermoanaerobaculia bacterium]